MVEILLSALPMLVCAFWSVLLLLDVLESRKPQKFMLFVFMVAATALYGGHFVFFNHLMSVMPLTDTVYCLCNLAVYPLFYLYVDMLTENPAGRRNTLLVLLPSLVAGLSVGILYALMSGSEIMHFIHDYLYHNIFDTNSSLSYAQSVVHHTAKVVFAFQIPPILVLGLRKIARYDALVVANYADLENKTLRMLKMVLVLFVALSLFSFIINLLGRYRFDGSLLKLAVPSLSFSVLLFMLGYVGYRQNFTIGNIVKDLEDGEVHGGNSVDSVAAGLSYQPEDDAATPQARDIGQLQQEIVETVRRQQLYLRHDLKVQDLAILLGTNRNYIYQAVAGRMGISFAEFINRQRIEHAVRLIKANPAIAMNDLSLASGYISTGSFYRNFKLYQGCTPKAFAEQIMQESEK